MGQHIVLLPPHGRDITFYDRFAPLISRAENITLQGDAYYWPTEGRFRVLKNAQERLTRRRPTAASTAGCTPHNHIFELSADKCLTIGRTSRGAAAPCLSV